MFVNIGSESIANLLDFEDNDGICKAIKQWGWLTGVLRIEFEANRMAKKYAVS